MFYTDLTKKAMEVCYVAHNGEVDKGGTPYVFHPMHIAEQFDDETSVCVALLHDVPESYKCRKYTIEYIRNEFGDAIADAVDAITRRTGETYQHYLKRVAKNHTARRVKIKDVEHNIDLSRVPPKTAKTMVSLVEDRYFPALEYLNSGYLTD